jgi:hypothetical protein
MVRAEWACGCMHAGSTYCFSANGPLPSCSWRKRTQTRTMAEWLRRTLLRDFPVGRHQLGPGDGPWLYRGLACGEQRNNVMIRERSVIVLFKLVAHCRDHYFRIADDLKKCHVA